MCLKHLFHDALDPCTLDKLSRKTLDVTQAGLPNFLLDENRLSLAKVPVGLSPGLVASQHSPCPPKPWRRRNSKSSESADPNTFDEKLASRLSVSCAVSVPWLFLHSLATRPQHLSHRISLS